MNGWLWAAFALAFCIGLSGLAVLRGSELERLAAVQLGAGITALTLVVMAKGYGRSVYIDVALVVAILSVPNGLVLVRFLEQDE